MPACGWARLRLRADGPQKTASFYRAKTGRGPLWPPIFRDLPENGCQPGSRGARPDCKSCVHRHAGTRTAPARLAGATVRDTLLRRTNRSPCIRLHRSSSSSRILPTDERNPLGFVRSHRRLSDTCHPNCYQTGKNYANSITESLPQRAVQIFLTCSVPPRRRRERGSSGDVLRGGFSVCIIASMRGLRLEP